MNRKIAVLALLACLSLTGCDKVKSLFNRKPSAQVTPAPAAASEPAPSSAPLSEPIAESTEPEAPPKAVVDSKSQVVVLCYHRLEGKAGGALSIEPALFEEQMQKIKDSDAKVISMQDFLAWRRGEKNIPPKSILITIDDGYVSSYEVGWPILKKHGFPFTMFVYLDYIGKGGKSISWEQLGEMRDAGVEIGSHTVSHQSLKTKGKGATDYDAYLKHELETSKKTIEDKLGIKVATIAYPFGLHNEKVHAAVRDAGYEAGFTTYGQRLGATTNFAALGRYDVTTKDARGTDSFTVALSFQGMLAPGGGDNVLAQDAAVAMVTQPANNEVISNPIPLIKANLASMGSLDAGTVTMRLSGFGLVPAQFDAASKTLSYTPAQELKPGSFTVIVSAKSEGRPREARWSFTYSPDGAAPPAEAALPSRADPKKRR